MAQRPAPPPPPPPPPPASKPTAPTTLTASSESTRRQRQHRRLNVRMSAEVRTPRIVFTATTRDLSEGGAGIVSDRPLSEGEEIALGLFLVVDDVEEHMPPLWVKGHVVWSGDLDQGAHLAGVRFDVISNEQKQWLSKVLSHLSDPAIVLPPTSTSGGSGR